MILPSRKARGLPKPFLTKRHYSFLLLFLSLFLAVLPFHNVEAGFLSNLLKFIRGGVEDNSNVLEYGSVLLPLLGSDAMPSLNEEAGGIGGAVLLPILATADSALIAPKNPIGILSSPYQDQILVYKVLPGDTPGDIASRFGISLNTLLWANNLSGPNLIKAGDELVILPVTGIQYEIKKGDTLESIAKRFKGDVNEIASFNDLAVDESLEIGYALIIPDGELSPPPREPRVSPRTAGLKEYQGYYLRPILGGRKSRSLHGFNAVDLASSCGSPVLASADGAAIIVRSSGWNGGYGKYLVLSHPNGTQTLYAHLLGILASPGQYLSQGSQIATVGSTGNSTGCHVHFEVRGARNPF